jgi:hypothetical protein
MNGQPSFLVTIDTEGDNLWSRPREITTRNASFLPRFQALCEKYGLKPTYLTNYEMATSEEFQEFGRDSIRRGSAEIGMHLHAWNSPPLVPLTPDDFHFQPYLIEYPEPVLREKVRVMTGILEKNFGRKARSHRAGRWSFNSAYARALKDHGYEVDCSVTPHVSWKESLGDPGQSGGTDFRGFPDHPYYFDGDDKGRPPLLEVPMTILPSGPTAERVRQFSREGSIFRRVWNRLSPPASWLRPKKDNLRSMLSVLDRAREEKRGYVEFMIHSSELMPNGSPNFVNDAEIERLYEHLETLFSVASRYWRGETLTEFARRFSPDALPQPKIPAHAS